RTDIADFLGLSKESVIRLLKKLQERKFIQFEEKMSILLILKRYKILLVLNWI
ncbi:MAG: helix-turn-helix domain-containing protein, partial [gamma proteobacterium symbiont of Bathyaustriella thionipta]|nr:helix-turn-helix domain-containing protein [gamma proteobacterium symbiont of Bathyaustriella thionipta]